MQIVHTTMQIVQIYLGKNYPYSTMQKLFAKISLEIRRRNAYCFAKSAQKGGVRIEPALECSIRQRYAGGISSFAPQMRRNWMYSYTDVFV